jgi:ABC-2 type transport system permease protein
MDDINRLVEASSEDMSRFYPLAGLFGRSFASGGFAYFLLFTGLSLVIYQALIWLIATQYKAINSALSGHVKSTDYQLEELSAASPLMGLYRKEWKRFISCSPYLINGGVGALMALMLAAALAIFGVEQLETSLGVPGFAASIERLLPYILGAMLAMSCISSSALSLEGKQLWILQSCPLSPKTIFDSKILVNLTLTVPVSLVSSLLVCLRLQTSFVSTLLIFLVPLSCALFSAIFGMFINIRMPRYDWETEIYIVKQSSSAIIGMLGSAGIILVLMGLSYIPFGFNPAIISIVMIIGLWIMSFRLYRSISSRMTLPAG